MKTISSQNSLMLLLHLFYGDRIRHTRWYTVVYGSRISPYTEQRSLSFNRFVFLHDLRIRDLFLVVSRRIRLSYMEVVCGLCISTFFSVNSRLRPCMFDLGSFIIWHFFFVMKIQMMWRTMHNVLHNKLMLKQVYLLYIEHHCDINNTDLNFKTKA